MILFNINYLLNGHISKYSQIRYETSTYEFGETQIQSIIDSTVLWDYYYFFYHKHYRAY